MGEAAALRGRILVVDDDRLVLATVTHGLSQAGFDVLDADNGDDAILLARQHRPDLALLDIRMEGKSGFDVAEYLREVGHTPFVFLSAFADDDTRAKVASLGALDYLVKPLDVARILPAVERALQQGRERSAAAPGLAPPSGAAAEPQGSADAVRPLPAGAPRAVLDEGDAALAAPVPIALGVLMHRFSLTRGEALARLRRQALSENRSLRAQAERVVQAVEDLGGAA